MTRKQIELTLIVIVTMLLTAVPVLAQTGGDITGPVTGHIVNQTAGGEAPPGLALMLHAWDGDFNEKLMLNGRTGPTGAFRFDEVRLNPDWMVAVMVTYKDVLYFSEPATLAQGQESLTIEVPVYETTTDTSQVRVDRQHVFFDAAQGGLSVGEIYVLSNLGDKTIAGQSDRDGQEAPLHFPLPQGAANPTFEGNTDGRFFLTPGGFADTAPLRPGNGTGQVVVRYVLPYEDGMAYSLTTRWPVGGVNFLVPEGIGLSLAGEGVTAEGLRDMGNGRQMAVFSRDALQPGETLELTLSGALASAAAPVAEATAGATAQPVAPQAIALGGIGLGLVLIGTGVWWAQRGHRQEDDAMPETAAGAVGEAGFDELVTRIAQLDEAHERGEIGDEAHAVQRSALRQQARVFLSQSEAVQ